MFLFLSFFFSMLCCLLMILNFIDHLFGQMEPTQAKEIVTEAHAVQYDNISHVCTMIFRLLFFPHWGESVSVLMCSIKDIRMSKLYKMI